MPRYRGTRSLAIMPIEKPDLFIAFGDLHLKVDLAGQEAKMKVTDVRFYEPDHKSLRRDIVDDVKRRLEAGVPAYAMLGLARHIFDKDGGYVHWLMANGLCLADRPVGEIP